MTLRDFLEKYATIGEIMVIREKGWQIAVTMADNDGLYIHSIHPRLLDLYDVVNFAYEQRNWATTNVLVVEILPTSEVIKNARERMVSR